jgi:hypothetical protein
MPKTATQRGQELRARRRKAGLVKIEFWVAPEHAKKLKQYSEKLTVAESPKIG